MIEKKLKSIETRIRAIKKELLRIGDMRPGSLTSQSRGGKGAYYQLSYTYQMKSFTEYVRLELVPFIRKQIEEYHRFKRLIEEWVGLAIKHSQLEIQLSKKIANKLAPR